MTREDPPLEAALIATLARFTADMETVFGSDLVDILIYGSTTLGDFTPHRGDIDYVVAVKDGVGDGSLDALFALHDRYRAREFPDLSYQLEGTCYPSRLLLDTKGSGDGCYIGTGRRGWKRIRDFRHNAFDLLQLGGTARRLLGSSIPIRAPSAADIRETVLADYDSWSSVSADASNPSYAIVQWAARVYFYYAVGRVGSKTESCARLYERYPSIGYIDYCKGVRSPVDMAEVERAHPEHREATRLVLDLIRRDIIEPGITRA